MIDETKKKKKFKYDQIKILTTKNTVINTQTKFLKIIFITHQLKMFKS